MCEHQQGIVSVLYLEKMNVDNGLCMLCQKEVVLEIFIECQGLMHVTKEDYPDTYSIQKMEVIVGKLIQQ